MRTIKNIFVAIALLGCIQACCSCPKCAQSEPVDFVNPLIGTLTSGSYSAGNIYPAIARPWGMNFWTAQTEPDNERWTYVYDHNTIRGLRQIHSPSPWIGDYGSFSIMPLKDASLYRQDERASVYSHLAEKATPYSYQIYLPDQDVLAKMVPTERAVIMEFTYPLSDNSGIVVDVFDGKGGLFVDKVNKCISGWTSTNYEGVPANFRNFITVKFDKEIEDAFVDGQYAVVKFKTVRGEKVTLKAASSFISDAQAQLNLSSEIGDKCICEIESEGRAAWNEVLGAISVKGNDLDHLRTFYSCLYRATLFPRKLYEVNAEGEIMHWSPYNGKIEKGYMYTDTGFWDTFRALFPLLNLVYPGTNMEIQAALANIARENPFLPEWSSPGHRDCMVGNNSASVVADGYLKGMTSEEDAAQIFKAVLYATEHNHPNCRSCGRLGHEYYNTLGYVPCNVGINENAARTLEYCYDDWCILQMGKKLGRPQEELDVFASRALNYKNLFDSSSKLMRGRNEDGSFEEPFSPYKWGGNFTEGNAWHYTWSVFHDVQGLVDLMGGEEDFVEMLDSIRVVPPIYDASYYGFRIHEIAEMQAANMGNYAHGNQPAQHVLYLYDWVRQPWKTQMYVRETMEKLYRATPDGYCGDEDNGQTSAWYIFSAMGFYPVCPASDEYALGAPLFSEIVITPLKSDGKKGKTITIEAPDAATKPYLKEMKICGHDWTHNFIKYSDLVHGVKISCTMSDTPCYDRGILDEDKPYSFSRE